MNRLATITYLTNRSPFLIDSTATFDMGYEFTAIVPSGVIFSAPGMLLDYSNGRWPLNQFKKKNKSERDNRLRDFLLEEYWTDWITIWEKIDDVQLSEIYDSVK